MKKAAALWIIGWAVFGLPWTGFTVHPRWYRVNLVPFRRWRRRDVVLNLFYYVPLGMLGVGFGWGVGPTLVVASAFSGATEVIQIFARDRFPSVTDLIMNVSGAAAGVVLVLAVRRIRRRTLSGAASHAPSIETRAHDE